MHATLHTSIPFVYHYLHSQSFPIWEQHKILQLDVHPRPSPAHQHEVMVKLRTLLHMNSMTHVLLDNLTVFYRMPSLPSRSGGISTKCLIPFKNTQDQSVKFRFHDLRDSHISIAINFERPDEEVDYKKTLTAGTS